MTVLVNNAGLSRRLRSIRRLEPDEQRPIIDVNLVGTLEVCRHVLPHMRRAGRGRIVNMSSMGSLAGKEGLHYLAGLFRCQCRCDRFHEGAERPTLTL